MSDHISKISGKFDLKFSVLAYCPDLCHGLSWALHTGPTETRYNRCLH